LAIHCVVDLADFLDAPPAQNTDHGTARSLAACGEMLTELLADTRARTPTGSAVCSAAASTAIATVCGIADPGLAYPDPELTDGVIRVRRWRRRDIECVRMASADPKIVKDTTVPAVFTPSPRVVHTSSASGADPSPARGPR
jgi:hypothetical protein